MRRYFLPVVVFVVVVAAAVLARSANDAADPGDPPDAATADSLGTPLLNVRRAPEWLRQPATDNLLEGAVLSAIANLGEADAHCLAVHRDGIEIATANETALLIPGELERLAVLAALDTLGSRGYTTEVVRSTDGVVTDGELDGDLWLVGGADPTLATAAYIDRFDDGRAYTSFDLLAAEVIDALRAAGITEINGSVIGDESKYEGVDRVYGEEWWSKDDIASNVVGPISALLLNNGFDEFPEEPDPPANSRADNPAIHAAAELTRMIEAAGIPVGGSPQTGNQPAATLREPVATIESPSLGDIAVRALLDGTTAEMVFREIAVRGGQEASQIHALLGVIRGLTDAGVIVEESDAVIPGGGLIPGDGSGLSNTNRLTCGVLINILDAAPGSLAVDALPTATAGPLIACAPTGLESLHAFPTARDEMTGVAGRAVASNGDVLSFALMVNWAPDAETGTLTPRAECDGIIPALLDAIASHPAGPGLDQLSPLDVVTAS
jgi:D-alanyl-D-alanine carboxypeptidase/D-alanyl-D-alanine-endopeptidase (penicillin-binding protein 4)